MVALWARTWALDVYRYCRRLLRSDADAEDVMQLVFLQAQRDFAQCQPSSSAKAWLLSIARHRCLDRLKMLARGPTAVDVELLEQVPSAEVPLDQRLVDEQAVERLAECLDALPDHSRVTVVLRYQEQLSYEHIERLTGAKAGALRVRVLRALTVLKQCLQDKGVQW